MLFKLITNFGVFIGVVIVLCIAGAAYTYIEEKAGRKRSTGELFRLGKKWYGWEKCGQCNGSGRINPSLSNDPLYRCDECEGFGSVGLRDFRRAMEEKGMRYRASS